MKRLFTFLMIAVFSAGIFVHVSGQNISDFTLKNTDGADVKLSSFNSKAAVVVIFTSNHCVYSKKYEDRIVSKANAWAGKNVQFLLINANNPAFNGEESMENMKRRAIEKKYNFPYLQDANGAIAGMFGATKNPEAFVLVPANGGFVVTYSGKIDDNALMPANMKEDYLENALNKIISGDKSPGEKNEAIGCNIKTE